MVRGKRFPGLVVAVLASCAPLVMGCESRVAQRGNLPDAARVAELKPGNIGRDEILEILGSSTRSARIKPGITSASGRKPLRFSSRKLWNAKS